MKKIKMLFAAILTLFMLSASMCAYAADADSLAKGTYDISASLSCYVNAMGGVEFGAPLLTSTKLTVDASGNKKITMYFTKSSVTIYSVTCDTFIDVNPTASNERGVANGTIGYYDKNGKLQTSGVTHTLSKDTAENSRKEQVNYVDSITFPVDSVRDKYDLTLYINSNVMGVQFCNENSSATETTYPASLTVDWSSVQSGSSQQKTNSNSNSNTKNNSNANNNANAAATTASSQNGAANANAQNDSNAGNAANAANNAQSGGTATTAANAANSSGSASSGTVVEKAGLNVHYANGTASLVQGESVSGESVTGTDGDVPFYVYLNMPFLIGMIIFGAVLAIGGGVLLYVSKKQKEKSLNADKEKA